MALKKINDDLLLRLIGEGNSPAEAARNLGVGRAAVCKRLKSTVWHWVRPNAQCRHGHILFALNHPTRAGGML